MEFIRTPIICQKCGATMGARGPENTTLWMCKCRYEPPADLPVYDETSKISTWMEVAKTLKSKEFMKARRDHWVWATGKSEGQ